MGSSASRAERSRSYQLEAFSDHSGGINVMALSEDEALLATGSDDKTVRLWTTMGDSCECIALMEGHEDVVYCLSMDDKYLWSGGADKTVRKWDLNTSKCAGVFRGHKSIVNRLLSTGVFVFSSSYDRTARCWDADTGECLRVFIGHKRGVYPIIFVPVDEGFEENNRENNAFMTDGSLNPNSSKEFSLPENKDLVITGSADFTAIIWSFETGKPIHVLKEHQGSITCMATDSQGKILLTGSTDHSIRSWDVRKGVRLRIFEGHQSSIVCLTVVNRMAYSGSSDQTARSWVIEFGDCARVYKGHEHTVSCIKYKDGLLFTAGGDGMAMCFGTKSATLLRTFKGHEVSINAIQIADGKLFTGSYDKTLRKWDISGLKELVIMKKGNAFDDLPDSRNSGNGSKSGDSFDENDQGGDFNS